MAHKILDVTTGLNGNFKIAGAFPHIFTTGIQFRVYDSTGNDGYYVVQNHVVTDNFAIVTVDHTTGVITVPGDLTHLFTNSVSFSISGSTSNDGDYTVSSSVLNGLNTDITINESFIDSVPDGNIINISETQINILSQFPIVAVNQTNQTFSIEGNREFVFVPGETFDIIGGTLNDGTYTIISATAVSLGYNSIHTVIEVAEAIPDVTVAGQIEYSSVDNAIGDGDILIGDYIINLSNPAKPTFTINPHTLDQTTNLNVPGRALVNYGEYLAENFFHILEILLILKVQNQLSHLKGKYGLMKQKIHYVLGMVLALG